MRLLATRTIAGPESGAAWYSVLCDVRGHGDRDY